MAVDAALNAARRLTFGPTPDLLREIRAKGVTKWLDEQLDHTSILDLEVETLLVQYYLPALPPLTLILAGNSGQAVNQQRSVVITRQIASKRQVFEVMAEFWANHFSIDGNNYNASFWRAWDDRNVARKFALSTFPQLLNASAHSPAMLKYLNNDVSIGSNPNENYARELMELHTVGVHGGYTEDDVHQAALALTGWTVDSSLGVFKFDPSMHYVGPLKVMGWKHSNKAGDNEKVGQSLINYLSTHPQTAKHLATKLVRRFIADAPPGGLSSKVAGTLSSTGFDIKAAVRTIATSKEFATSDGTKYKRPAEWVISSLRALGSKPNLGGPDTLGAQYPMQQLGQIPFGWVPPNGYPDEAPAWQSTAQTVSRWNIARQIAYNGVGGMAGYQPSKMFTVAPKTVGELVDRVANVVLGRGAGIDEKAAILEYLGRPAGAKIDVNTANALIPEAVSMLLASPTMQVR